MGAPRGIRGGHRRSRTEVFICLRRQQDSPSAPRLSSNSGEEHQLGGGLGFGSLVTGHWPLATGQPYPVHRSPAVTGGLPADLYNYLRRQAHSRTALSGGVRSKSSAGTLTSRCRPTSTGGSMTSLRNRTSPWSHSPRPSTCSASSTASRRPSLRPGSGARGRVRSDCGRSPPERDRPGAFSVTGPRPGAC